MFLAVCAELGTFLAVPIAIYFGFSIKDAASAAMVGGADGPMVLFTALNLSKNLFVPITVVAYLYLGLTYGGYPYLIRLLIPKKLRGIQMVKPKVKSKPISSNVKLAFASILCVLLCLMFPGCRTAFFLPVYRHSYPGIRLTHIQNFIEGPLLYGSTFFLGLLLGILCEAHLILNPQV